MRTRPWLPRRACATGRRGSRRSTPTTPSVRCLTRTSGRSPSAGQPRWIAGSPRSNPYPAAGIAGDLYVTSHRLILVGRHTVTFDLADIADVVISGERLLLVMRDGSGVTLDVDQPRLLRVQVAAAREAARI